MLYVCGFHTENRTRWTQHGTDTSLKERASNIQNWKDILQKHLEDTEIEIGKVSLHMILMISWFFSYKCMYMCLFGQLTEYKERCEWCLELKGLPLDVVIECLALREQRTDIDLVSDVVENELQKVIEDWTWVHIHNVHTCTCSCTFTSYAYL